MAVLSAAGFNLILPNMLSSGSAYYPSEFVPMISEEDELAAAIHDYDPYVCVTLAARSGLEHAYNSDAQVWWEWDDEGILDFVCPMNYSEKPYEYIQSIREHFPLVKGSIPYYGGIGLFRMKDHQLLIEAIQGGRELGQDGFVIFSYE